MYSSPLVFVVDDDEAVGVSIGRLLRSAGYDARYFTSADAFLRRPPDERPARVVVDQQMPGVSGLELQRGLIDAPGLASVFLTGHGDVSTSVAA